jgi:hypothetical protein
MLTDAQLLRRYGESRCEAAFTGVGTALHRLGLLGRPPDAHLAKEAALLRGWYGVGALIDAPFSLTFDTILLSCGF